MKFSANLGFLFPEISSILKKYSAAYEAGFKGVECGDVYKHSVEELVAVQKETRLHQVLLNSYCGDGRGFAAVPGKEGDFQNSLEISIKYCNALKCPRLHILAGLYPQIDDTKNLKDLCTATFVNNLKYASQRVLKEHITLIIEPISAIPNYFLTRTDQAVDILEQVGCGNVKLQLDLYHHQRTHGRIVDTLRDHWQYTFLYGARFFHFTTPHNSLRV